MTPPRLIVVSDFTRGPAPALFERLERCLRAARPGSVLVQLREHGLGARDRLALGRSLVALARAHEQRFAVNDRLDLAVLLGADAVHLGESSVPSADARRLLPGAWLSRAWHAPDAPTDGADALVLSPIFAPRHGRPALGVEALSRARTGGALLYALGGVGATNAARALESGAAGVAVVGAVLEEDDPSALLWALGIER